MRINWSGRVTALALVSMLVVATAGVHAADPAPLADALKARDMAKAADLIARKVAIDVAQPDGTTPLHWAVYWSDTATVQALLAAGADPRTANRYKESPLSVAASNANAGMLELLLKAGADANTTSGEGEPVLMTAARKGGVDAVRTLLARGANVNATEGWHRQTALMWAAGEGHTAVVKTLLEVGAQVDAVSEGGFTALHFAARDSATEAGRLLIASGADVNRPLDGNGPRPLMLALMNASYDLAATMLEWGADASDESMGFGLLTQLVWTAIPPAGGIYPPGPEIRGRTSKMTAMQMAQMLLDYGADPNAGQMRQHPQGYKLGQIGEFGGLTPLMLAARMQDLDLMRLMLANGGDGTVTTWNRTNLLMVAVGLTVFLGEMPAFKPGSYMETVKLAYEVCGCDVNDQNANGWTAAHAAVHNEGNEALRWLASKGARLDIKTYYDNIAFPWIGEGKTPMRLAQGQFVAMSYKYYCPQQVVLRELMNLPPAECVRIPNGETEPLRGGGQ
jgi:uncharacterized protein